MQTPAPASVSFLLLVEGDCQASTHTVVAAVTNNIVQNEFDTLV